MSVKDIPQVGAEFRLLLSDDVWVSDASLPVVIVGATTTTTATLSEQDGAGLAGCCCSAFPPGPCLHFPRFEFYKNISKSHDGGVGGEISSFD